MRDPKDPGTLDLLAPLRRRGRPPGVRKPKSDAQRGDQYRTRLRASGGARLTLNPARAQVLKRVLEASLQHGLLDDADRVHLQSILQSLPEPAVAQVGGRSESQR